MPDDFYVVLGVPRAASTAAIRSAYRRLAVTLHPDRAGAASTAAFQRVVAAYEVLSNPHRRAAYDADRRVAPKTTATPAPQRSAVPLAHIARVSGPLRSLLNCGIVRHRPDDTLELTLTRDEAEQGGHVGISTSKPDQFMHWLTIPPGTSEGEVVSSVIRADGRRIELRFVIRVV